jgi:PAS domain S-box-containing protein
VSRGDLLRDSAEDLFENAPCGYLSTDLDGVVLKVNRTFERWTGYSRADLIQRRRFQELLTPGGKIYHETHYAPLLRMQGAVREIAVEIIRADGSRFPALVNSVVERGADDQSSVVRTTVFDATERRRYESELLAQKQRAERVAETLQKSLLSADIPAAPGLAISVVYRAGEQGLSVGGDWWDAFWLEDGERVALVVGDVVGRGLEAAATMGQLRSAVRALASTDLSPAALTTALDRYALRHGVGTMATLVYAELDLSTRAVTYSAAGHPPPLVIDPAQEPAFLWDGRSLPLGIGGEPDARAEARHVLPVGARLLLYSDGLVERRAGSLPEDLERLASAAASEASLSAPELAQLLVRDLPDGAHPDDVCLLLAELGGSRPT